MVGCESRFVRALSPKAGVYISDSLPLLVHLIRHYYNAWHHPDFRTLEESWVRRLFKLILQDTLCSQVRISLAQKLMQNRDQG